MNAQNPRWMKLDNAAKIYPAAISRSWSATFRISASITEPVDPAVLQLALTAVLKRFPSFAMRLRRGAFWYYFEEIGGPPDVREDEAYPCAKMSRREIRKCCFRVLYYENRIAVEFFHALTDGTGGLIFVKTLAAEYLQRKYGASIPFESGVLDRAQEPATGETEDSFLCNEGRATVSRKEANAFHVRGSREADGFLNLTTGIIPLGKALAKAKSCGVTLTVFLASVMISSVAAIQNEAVHPVALRKPVKVMIPVNLRPYFQSNTLRNFSSYINPGIDPRLGDYDLEEIMKSVHHQMGNELTAKKLCARITTNVKAERNPAIKAMPLFVKNVSMKMVYKAVGDRKYSIVLSNLGAVSLPDEMKQYISRMDFILGAPAQNTSICGVLSYNGALYVNILRTIREPALEHAFFTSLRKLGLPVKIESNRR